MSNYKSLTMTIMLVSFLIISLTGCASAPVKKQIGENRYQIQIVQGFSGWNEWDEAARQACPNGYKVIERSILRGIPDLMAGTIECELTKGRSPATKTEEAKVKPSITSAPTDTVKEIQLTYLIITAATRIRSEPNNKSKIISKVNKGERVVNLGSSGSWFNVELSSGLSGWVFKTYTKEAR